MTFNTWTTEKPAFDCECLVVCASYILGDIDYILYEITKLEFDDEYYWAWCDGQGAEVADLKDLKADKYFVIEK